MIYGNSDYLSGDETRSLANRMKADGYTRLRGNSFYTFHNGSIHMFSYETAMCSFDTVNNVLVIRHNFYEYSRSSCQHVSLFLRKFLNVDYSTIKKACIEHGIEKFSVDMLKVITF